VKKRGRRRERGRKGKERRGGGKEEGEKGGSLRGMSDSQAK